MIIYDNVFFGKRFEGYNSVSYQDEYGLVSEEGFEETVKLINSGKTFIGGSPMSAIKKTEDGKYLYVFDGAINDDGTPNFDGDCVDTLESVEQLHVMLLVYASENGNPMNGQFI